MKCLISLSEELESYLVFLLMRFIKKPEIALKIMAIDFLSSLELTKTNRNYKLRDIGDICLLFSGLYPELNHKRLVSDSYYSDLGQNAYYIIAQHSTKNSAELFYSLSKNFLMMASLLKNLRPKVSENILPKTMLKNINELKA